VSGSVSVSVSIKKSLLPGIITLNGPFDSDSDSDSDTDTEFDNNVITKTGVNVFIARHKGCPS